MSWRCTVPTKTESPDSTGITLEEIQGPVRITVLLLTCPLPLPLSSCRLLNPVVRFTQPPTEKGEHDCLEGLVGREMQESSV